MSNRLLTKLLVIQVGIVMYLSSSLGTSYASYFDRPLDMSRLCSAPICSEITEDINIEEDGMVVSTLADRK